MALPLPTNSGEVLFILIFAWLARADCPECGIDTSCLTAHRDQLTASRSVFRPVKPILGVAG